MHYNVWCCSASVSTLDKGVTKTKGWVSVESCSSGGPLFGATASEGCVVRPALREAGRKGAVGINPMMQHHYGIAQPSRVPWKMDQMDSTGKART